MSKRFVIIYGKIRFIYEMVSVFSFFSVLLKRMYVVWCMLNELCEGKMKRVKTKNLNKRSARYKNKTKNPSNAPVLQLDRLSIHFHSILFNLIHLSFFNFSHFFVFVFLFALFCVHPEKKKSFTIQLCQLL